MILVLVRCPVGPLQVCGKHVGFPVRGGMQCQRNAADYDPATYTPDNVPAMVLARLYAH